MRHDSFAALILTHGRPDNVITERTLRRQGYTGRIVFVLDDEDKTADLRSVQIFVSGTGLA